MDAIKKIWLFLLVMLVFSASYAQDSLKTLSVDKKREKKILLLQYQYTSGEYDELTRLSEQYYKKLKKKNNSTPSDDVAFKLLGALGEFANMKFSSADKLVEDAISIKGNAPASLKETVLSNLYLARYFIETGNYKESKRYISVSDSLSVRYANAAIQAEINISKAEIFAKQEFYSKALTLIDAQYDYRLKMASEKAVTQNDQYYKNPVADFSYRKEQYAKLINLKIEILIQQNQYQEADLLIQNGKEWIKKNLGSNSNLYRDALMLEASKENELKKYGSSAIIYQKAYSGSPYIEGETNKIDNLSATIIANLKSGDQVRSQNYLRRLQMYAYKNAGDYGRFQLVYNYTLAAKLYQDGSLEAAKDRLESLLKTFSAMPQYHYWYIRIKELETEISDKNNDIQLVNKIETQLAEIKEKYYGEQTPSYHKALLNMAVKEIKYGRRFKYAETVFRKSYDGFLKTQLSKNSKDNSYYLDAYAELFMKTDRLDSAMKKAKEVAVINRIVYGEGDAVYVLSLTNYTEYCILAGKYQEGLDSLKKVMVLSDLKTGEIEVRQKTWLSIARLNKLFGEYDKSQSLTNKAYRLRLKSNYDIDFLVESETAEQLSNLYVQTGNYYKAEKTLQKALKNVSEKLGDNSPKLIPIYFEYARLNLITGNYTQSDAYLNKVLPIIDSVYGVGSLTKSESYLLAGDYFMLISDYKKAEESYLKADNIQKLKLGKKHLKRAETILRLAYLYNLQPDFKKAEIEKLYKEALDIVKSDIGSSNPLFAETEQKYAEFLINTGSYDQADKLLEEANQFWNSKLGGANKYVAEIELLRGNIAYAKSKYDQAEKYYSKSKNSYLSVFNDNHPGYIKAVGKLARVYYMSKQTDKALATMEEIIPKHLQYAKDYFPSLSFRQKSKYWNNLREEFEFYASIALIQAAGKNTKYTGKVYDNVLSTKALLLTSSIKLMEKILNSHDSVLVDLYNKWITEKEYLISMLSFSKQQLADQGINLTEIQSDVEQLEKQISQRSDAFSKEESSKKIVWENVRDKLLPNEYAIEIIRLRRFDKVFTDSVIYAAMIISKDTKDNPDIVLINNGRQMEKKFLKYYRNASILNIEDAYSYSTYWQPIKAKIPDNALVYISSDGVYNQLNLEMLRLPDNSFIIDHNQIVLLTNTKDLLNIEEKVKEKKGKSKSAKKLVASQYVLCGSPDFYTNKKITNKHVQDLPGAEKEIIELNTLLVSSEKNTLTLLKNNVTEDTIKTITSPKVLHVATHGYFKESTNTGFSEDDIATHPLLNSGLMLLGSGDIVDNADNKYVNQKSGILTAYEAMDLSLDNTELVVLSACETGRGEIQVGEGVYGLQRAFLVAGAKAIIISLFKVNDEVTQKLMLSFYQKWLKTNNKRQAFVDAKKEIKQQYKEPIFWGAFIMIEGKPERESTNN